MEKIFVYGTLMTGFENNYLLSNSKLIGKAFTCGKFKMVARFIPFLTKEPLTHILGEVYEVDDQCLKIIDDLEGHPNYYKRELIPVEIPGNNFEVINAWVYLNEEKSSPRYTLVESGNYYEYRFNNEKLKSEFAQHWFKEKKEAIKAAETERSKNN